MQTGQLFKTTYLYHLYMNRLTYVSNDDIMLPIDLLLLLNGGFLKLFSYFIHDVR